MTAGSSDDVAGCRYMRTGNPAFCYALEKPYIPDVVRLDHFCRSANHRECPFQLYWAYREKYFNQEKYKYSRLQNQDT